MIASDTARISVRFPSAALVSILATSWARSPTTSRTAIMSAGARTNDTAMNSTPADGHVSASTRSSSVGVASRDRSEGRWTPGHPCARPPFSTTATAEVGRDLLDAGADRSITDDHAIADRQIVEEPGVVDADHVGIARSVADLEADDDPRLQQDARRQELPCPDLGSGEVGEHPDRLADRGRDRPHAFETAEVFGGRSRG